MREKAQKKCKKETENKLGWRKYETNVRNVLLKEQYINGVGIIDDLPSPDNTRSVLEHYFKIHSDRNFRVIMVEDYQNYKVFIQLPGDKCQYDFYVWRAIFIGREMDLRVPSHDELAELFSTLKSQHPDLEEYLINAVIKLIRDRWGVSKIIKRYFSNLNSQLIVETAKFLSTLKWIVLEEDVNYPPSERKMGSKYTLAVYALLEAGFTMNEIRRIIRF